MIVLKRFTTYAEAEGWADRYQRDTGIVDVPISVLEDLSRDQVDTDAARYLVIIGPTSEEQLPNGARRYSFLHLA